jgi:hypothetical protein
LAKFCQPKKKNSGENGRGVQRRINYLIPQFTFRTSGVSHCGIAIYIKKYLKAKEELWKFKYFSMQKYNLQKNPKK